MPRHAIQSSVTRRTMLGRLATTALSLSISLAAVSSALGQGAADPPLAVGEGRLYNLTPRPFTVQLHRKDGVKWTDGYVIQPGKFHSVRVPRPGDRDDIMGVTGNGEGFVIVRFREAKLGGFMTLRLTATNPASLKRQPTWFAVEDANGIVRLVQETGVAEATALQENLKKQPPMTPAELETMRQTLRNNWVLTN
jgi:hypothetical protein